MTWWLVTFSRTGPARYLSHLDTSRAIQRTFARAGVALALSQGMRPKPRLSLPLPLPVGAAGSEELAVVEVPDGVEAGAATLRRLREAAPPGLEPSHLTVAGERHPRPQAAEAEYACVLDGDAGAVRAAVERYAEEGSVEVLRVSPKGTRAFDLKEYVAAAATAAGSHGEGTLVRFTVRHRADGAARPQEFIDLIAGWAGVDAAMRDLRRVRIAWRGLPAGRGPGAGRSVTE
jgi:radical SAM-linked protein